MLRSFLHLCCNAQAILEKLWIGVARQRQCRLARRRCSDNRDWRRAVPGLL